MGWLDGEVALITGGGSGLGKALIGRFLEEGARIGVLELRTERAAALRDEFGGDVHAIAGDATLYADNQRAVAETVARFGKLDLFVGNAAVWDFSIGLEALPEDRMDAAFDELFHLNVRGYLYGAKAAAPRLRETRGSILFSLSNAAFYAGGGGPLYTAGKHAVVGLVRQLAYELAPDIRVNGVAPGGMRSDLRGLAAFDMGNQSFGAMPVEELTAIVTPLEVGCTADDYGGAYTFLASRRAGRVITGEIVRADGGMAIRGRHEAERIMAEFGNRA